MSIPPAERMNPGICCLMRNSAGTVFVSDFLMALARTKSDVLPPSKEPTMSDIPVVIQHHTPFETWEHE